MASPKAPPLVSPAFPWLIPAATLTSYTGGTVDNNLELPGRNINAGTYTVLATTSPMRTTRTPEAATYRHRRRHAGRDHTATRQYEYSPARPRVAKRRTLPAPQPARLRARQQFAMRRAPQPPEHPCPTPQPPVELYPPSHLSRQANYAPVVNTATYTINGTHSSPIAATGLPGADVLLSPLSTAASTDGGTLLLPRSDSAVARIGLHRHDGGTQQFLYHPGVGAFTSDSFTYQVTDSFGGVATTTATVNYVGTGLVASSLNPRLTDLVVVGTSGNHNVSIANANTPRS